VDELSGATDLVLGIKEAPVPAVQKLLSKGQKKRAWMMFSHTHKGQVCALAAQAESRYTIPLSYPLS